MSDIEYGVHVVDTAPGSGVCIESCLSLGRAQHRLTYWQNMNKTRRTYGITARIMQRAGGGEWHPVDVASDPDSQLPADEHHFDVSCDDRPYCEIPQHHAMEDTL